MREPLAGFCWAVALVTLGCVPEPKRYVVDRYDLEIPVASSAFSSPARTMPAGSAGALIDLRTQVDFDRLGRRLSERELSRRERRDLVVTALARVADGSQAALVGRLEDLQRRGAIRGFRTYSIVNRIWVDGPEDEILELARHPAVASLEWETESEAPAWTISETPPCLEPREASRTSWALAAIGADTAHERGLRGAGVVIGILDSGAGATHEQLAPGFLGPERGWHDPIEGRESPNDGAFGHGSAVLSAAVGANVGGIRLGVAPAARWTACAALPDGHYNNALLTECADWMLNVGQPDVLINAWALPESGCDPSLRRIVNAWRAAEILPVFAAGNDGRGPRLDRSPANYVDLYPGGMTTLSVGGLASHGGPFALSTSGPNSCAPESTFPTLTAPAEDLIAALPLTTSSYRQVNGTSFAAGLVAGAAAILLEAHPESSVAALERALLEGAVDLGAPGPDGVFGHGRLDIPGALAVLAEIESAAAPDG